jgi:hypothetical protein
VSAQVLRALLAASVFAASVSTTVLAQSAPITTTGSSARSGRAAVVTTPPTIDGRIDEETWRAATPFNAFTQREPVEGTPVSERTEVRIVTDGVALYVAATLLDREPRLIVPGEKVRDVTLTNSDYFAFILDTYHDRQNGFLFGTTPSGIEHDAQVIREGEGGGINVSGQGRAMSGSMGGVNLNWDATWTVATSQDSLGWYAEFRIPFSTLRYGSGATQVWGLNIMRGIRRRNEEALWSPVSRQFGITRLSQAGLLEGIAVPVRRTATVTPYVLGAATRHFPTESDYRTPGDWGIDAKWGITPSLTADLTVNTDFAQVEVDEQRTNLTRFPVFFPEKRPFFLENAGTFAAGTPQAVDLFFTRRIGIDSVGQPVPIIAGGRVTGRVAGLTVGAIHMITDETANAPSNAFTVARVVKELSARSRVGVIAVDRSARNAAGDGGNRVFAADGRIGLGQDWTADLWAANSQTDGRTGDENAFSGRVAYQTRDWTNSIRVIKVGDDFNPEVGFMSRPAGYRLEEIAAMRLYRKPGWTRIRQWNPHTTIRRYVGTDGFVQSSQVHLDATEIEFADGGRFGPEFNRYSEGLQAPFTIAPGVVLPPGQYEWWQYGLDWATNPSAPYSLSSRVDVGEFYSGTRNGGNVTLTARRGSSFTSSLLLDYQDVNLPQGDFIRKLIGVRMAYFFTPRIFVQSLTQYSNQAQLFNANLRFAWLNTAGTGLFIVFNDGEDAESFTRWTLPVSRTLTLKYTRQFDLAR